MLSEVVGREIVHRRITIEEGTELWTSFGLDKGYVIELMKFEQSVGITGSEEASLKEPNVIKGKRTLREYIVNNRARWIPQ